MAATEFDILRDEQERSYLLRSIAAIESAIAAAMPGTRRILENTVENARKRVTTLDKKIEESKVEHAAAEQAQNAAAALAAKETKLNASEREAYRGFLEESYFTKRDFGKLDEFYTHGYDRLSEGGKEEMSKRIHEGIKRGEFKESDLPESVLKRDAKLYRDRASEPIGQDSRARKQNAALEEASTVKASDGKSAKPPTASPKSDIDFSSVDLKSIKLVAAVSEPSAASIPNAPGQSTVERA